MDMQQKAIHARGLLQDEVLAEALEVARQNFYEEWVVAKTVEEREKAHGKTLGLVDTLSHLVWLGEQYEEPEEDPDNDTLE